MAMDVIMPKEGITMEEGTIAKWLKQDGEKVEKGEPLLEILTDKVSLEVESPGSGDLHIIVPAGETVPITTLIGVITEEGEEFLKPSTAPANEEEKVIPTKEFPVQEGVVAESKVVQEKAGSKEIISSPRARKLAKELGVELQKVQGTGLNGRIQAEDVELFAAQKEETPKASAKGVSLKETAGDELDYEVVPLQGIRRIIAERLTECTRNIPQVTFFREVDASKLIAARTCLLAEVEKETGIRLTLTDLLLKILAGAIKAVKYGNALVEGDQIKILKQVNVSLAVAGDGVLYTPVIKNVEAKGLSGIAQERARLVKKAREGRLTPEELSGGTVTLSNLGQSGVEGFTPILNPPQTVIVGVGGIKKKPVVEEEQIKISKVMTLSLTCDHRVLDGADATRVLEKMVCLIENPYMLLV